MFAQPVLLVDFACYKPPEELKAEVTSIERNTRHWDGVDEDVKQFMWKVHRKSGLADHGTYLPPALHPNHTDAPRNDMDAAAIEAKMVMCGAVQELLDKTKLKATDIDILVTTCSIYCPTPSLASMLVNNFKMRQDIQSYHLGGMGCGNGVMAVGLIRDLLQARPNSIALFVPAEITTYCYYPGKEKHRMLANVIFRMGGAAALFSNKSSLRSQAKYQLLHSVRVHCGQDDGSYQCMGWGPDKEGINGVFLSKDVTKHAGYALKQCLTVVTPRIMTWKQYGEAAWQLVQKRVLGKKELPSYQPAFTECIDHFLIHAGGYAILKGIQKGMSLPHEKVLPSFAALRDYGNTSCSTTWYILGYTETCLEVKRGQRIMQNGMGGGVKAGVNVWQALRDVHDIHPAWQHLANTPLTEADLPRSIDEEADAKAAERPAFWKQSDTQAADGAVQLNCHAADKAIPGTADGQQISSSEAAADGKVYVSAVKTAPAEVEENPAKMQLPSESNSSSGDAGLIQLAGRINSSDTEADMACTVSKVKRVEGEGLQSNGTGAESGANLITPTP